MPVQKFIGYAPDADPATPGVLTECEMMEPALRGMKSAPSAAATNLPALVAECRGASAITKLDGTRRLFAGTQTDLYEAGSATWTGVSSATYTGSAESMWDFAQWGNITLAVNGVDLAQESTSGAFSDLTAMPIATLVCAVSNFVMVANIADASYTHPDGWWSCALGNYTDWTPSIATQSARGRLIDTPGKITALKALGSDVVAFKHQSVYLGRYVGPDIIWSWQQVPGTLGVQSQKGVVSDGTALYFWGGDDFYRFDGTRPQPIGEPVKRWFRRNASQMYLHKMAGQFDRERSLVRWYFVAGGGSALNSCIVFNAKSGQWGRADRTIEAVVDYVSAAITWDSPGILTGLTWDDATYTQSWDSPFWLASSESPAIIDSTHTLKTLTGVSGASSVTTGDIGDDDVFTLLRRVRPRYSTHPTTAAMKNYWTNASGSAVTPDQTVNASDGKFDVLQSARWHRLRFDWTGDTEVSGINADMVREGER